MRFSLLFALVLVPPFGTSLFQDSQAEPLTIPELDKVDRIVVRKETEPRTKPIVIRDKDRIAEVLKFVKERNSNWRRPWATFPGSEYNVKFEAKKGRRYQMLLVLWVKPYLGGRDGGQNAYKNRLQDLTQDDRKKLSALLGLKDPNP